MILYLHEKKRWWKRLSIIFLMIKKIWHTTLEQRVKVFHAPKIFKCKETAGGQAEQGRQHLRSTRPPTLHLSGRGQGADSKIASLWERLYRLLTIDSNRFRNETAMLNIISEVVLAIKHSPLPEVKGEKNGFKKLNIVFYSWVSTSLSRNIYFLLLPQLH